MKNRPLILLAIVVVALIAISVIQKTNHRRAVSSSDTTEILKASFAPEDINRVVVGAGVDTNTVVLEKLPDHWVARTAWSHPVAQRKIDDLLKELVDLRGEFRSKNPAILADYGLADTSDVLTLTLFGKDWEPVFSLMVGDRSSNGAGAFVRAPGSDSVYLTRANILGRLGMYGPDAKPTTRYFLDLQVFKTDRKDVRSIVLHEGDDVLTLEKVYPQTVAPDTTAADSTGAAADTTSAKPDYSVWEWVLAGKKDRALAKTKVDAVLNAVANIQAADVDDPKTPMEDYGLWKAERRVEVNLADGSTFELRVGADRPKKAGVQEGRWCMTSKDRTIWVIRDFKIDQIFKKLDDLLPDS